MLEHTSFVAMKCGKSLVGFSVRTSFLAPAASSTYASDRRWGGLG